MYNICKKEVSRFFSSLTGYIAIVLFLLVTGIFLFILPSSSILNNNYATLDAFFELSPWVLLFLIPAIGMYTLADEFKTGTYEILKTKPISSTQIVVGKYVAILVVILLVIIPTVVYIYCIKSLSANAGIDAGAIAGSYIGLIFLASVYAAISLCCSSFTNNAIVAFLISIFCCITLYFGFNGISKLPFFVGNADYYIELFGIDYHYRSISRGVIDSRDVIYFCSLIALFLLITFKKLEHK